MPDYMVGLDLGSNRISTTLSGETENGEFKILHSINKESKGINKGIVSDTNALAICIKECMDELIKISNVGVKDVYVGVGTYQSRVISTKGIVYIDNKEEIISRKYINEAISNAKKVSLSNDEVVVECIVNKFYTNEQGFVENPINLKAESLEVNVDLIISNRQQINNIENAFKLAGFNIKGFTLRINSLKNMFFGEKTSTSKVLLVDIGAEKTELAFYKYNELVALSYISLGGENITKDLAICTSLPREETETIKKMYSSSFVRKKIDNEAFKAGIYEIDNKLFYDIVMARIDEIVNYIYEDINNAGFYDEVNSIILIGDGINYFEGIKNLVEMRLGKKTMLITKYDLDLQNSSIISSIGIVKDAYDNVKLLCDEVEFYEDERNNIHSNKDTIKSKKTYFEKIRGFLEDIF